MQSETALCSINKGERERKCEKHHTKANPRIDGRPIPSARVGERERQRGGGGSSHPNFHRANACLSGNIIAGFTTTSLASSVEPDELVVDP